MLAFDLPFTLLTPGVGIGSPLPTDWRTIDTSPLLIVVGVTGVGKSTMLAHLAHTEMAYTLLPDRRVLTDQLIIAQMQVADGDPIQPVSDRKVRFDFTRRYRAHFPGGMAHALAQLTVQPSEVARWLVFDGLRGENEVAHAVQALPAARFVILDAPDMIRVQRLLGRNDSFDQLTGTQPDTGAFRSVASFAALGVPEAETIFTPDAEQALFAWAQREAIETADLAAKLQIVVEERRNYDPAGALATLQNIAPARTLYIDTVACPPREVAQRTARWLNS